MFARLWLTVLGLWATLGWSLPAHAASELPISVERGPGAEDCPDGPALVARVESIIGHGNRADATAYRVTFSRSPQAFTAAIRSGAEGTTVRYLDAHEPSCSALAHATAIALAVLFDADLSGATERPEKPGDVAKPTPAPATPAPSRPAAPAPSRPATPGMSRPASSAAASSGASKLRIDPRFSLGAAALVGVLRPVVFALVADAGVESESFRASLGALWAAPQNIDLPPGRTRESLISGSLRACYALARPAGLRLDVCSGVLVGAATADAQGFTRNQRHSELFLALPVELAVSGRSRFVGWQLGASALALLPPNQFEVAGVGPTYTPAPVAGLFALSVFVEPLR